MSSKNGYADYTVPDMLTPTADYRISRIDNNNYSVNYTINRYVPYNPETQTGGNYRSEQFTQPIDMTYGIRGLDPQVYSLESWFKTIREENRLARKKDQQQYGIK